MRTYLHLEYQFIGYQIDDVLGAHIFSYLEAWSPIVLQGGDVRQMAFLCTKNIGKHHWYRKCTSGVPTRQRHQVRGRERNCGRKIGGIGSSAGLISILSSEIQFRTVKILQNAFSHITCTCPRRPDRAEKPGSKSA